VIHEDIEGFAAALPERAASPGSISGPRPSASRSPTRLRSVATPLVTIKRRKFGQDAAQLSDIVAKRELAGLVLGLPRNMDGSEGPRAQSTRAFARNLAKHPDFEGSRSPSGTSGSARLRPKGHCWRRIRHENVAPR
jgi:putative Holliday junction resolvase